MQHSKGTLSDLAAQRHKAAQVPTSDTLSSLMPIKDAAVLLDVSEMTVRRAFEAGEFPGIKFGRTYRVSRAFVDAVLAAVAAGHRVVVEDYAAAWLARETA
jgi:excisionase family DNA binding protein